MSEHEAREWNWANLTSSQLEALQAVRPTLQWHELPTSLTPQQRFRLIEIAHKTDNSAIRNAAIRLLLEAENPGIVVGPRGEP